MYLSVDPSWINIGLLVNTWSVHSTVQYFISLNERMENAFVWYLFPISNVLLHYMCCPIKHQFVLLHGIKKNYIFAEQDIKGSY